MRTALRIIVILLVLAILGAGAYIGFKYFNKTTPAPEEINNQEIGGVQPNENNLLLTSISPSPAVGYWNNDNSTYYVSENGQII